MRLREFLVSAVLISFALITAKASPSVLNDGPEHDLGDDSKNVTEASMSAPLPSAPSRLVSEDKVFRSAYYDTLSILSADNQCSDFFGGPASSVDIFNQLIGKVRKDYFSSSVGVRMSGATAYYANARTQKEYRLFERVSINLNGPFYRKKISPWDAFIPGVGTFKPNTKEARVLMFLHELGHIVKGEDGGWLLPDDGNSEDLSRLNSKKIEDVCGDQIKHLHKGDITHFPEGKQTDGKVARAISKP